jgi:hypothetical protein
MAKVKIEAGQTMKSPKALATQLLGGKEKASDSQIKALATKIREKNDLEKGQDLTAGMVLKVGKVTTQKFGTLVDPSDTNKFSFVSPASSPTTSSPSPSGGVIGSRPEPVPEIPRPEPTVKDTSTKSATPDIILLDQDDLPIDLILNLTLEKIGGQELITIARHDTVNGQNIVYQPIKNISDVAIAYNSQNIISFPDSSDNYFKSFPIKLEAHIPQYTPDTLYIDMIPRNNNVFLDLVNSSIVIENINMKRDYDIEVQMISSGKVFNDTIYDEDNL